MAKKISDDGCRTHYITYVALKRAVKEHILSQVEPHLSECEKPIGGQHWQPLTDDVRALAICEEAAVVMDGPDIAATVQDFE